MKSRFSSKGGYVDPNTLPITEDGWPACRWCAGSVLPPRKTFCSKDCVHQHLLRTRSSYVRDCLYRRDKGVCSICREDTKKIARDAKKIIKKDGGEMKCGRSHTRKSIARPGCRTKKRTKKRNRDNKNYPELVKLFEEHDIPLSRKVWLRKYGGGLWDADHIVPVHLGGGECGLENYRTLCIPCHQAVTIYQAKERAKSNC